MIRRLVLALAMAITSALIIVGSAQPAAAECKPPEVPDRAGTGLPGQIDDETTSSQPDSLYGSHGWAGLRWTTCELSGFAGLPTAESAMVSAKTQIGNGGLGFAAFLGALTTQLGQWAIDPGDLMEPIDEVIGDVTETVVNATWAPYAAVVIILAALGIILNSLRGEVRAALRTAAAVLIACLAIAWVTTPVNGESGAEHAASMFDDLATKVNGDVMGSLNQYVGDRGNSSDETVGATMQDQLLYKIWAQGALGSETAAKEYGEELYKVAAVGWDDLDEADSEQRRDQYDDLVQQIKEEDPAAYDAIRGVGSGRVGIGGLAALDLLLIALVRVPAEIFMIAGLLLLRAFVMFVPILALLAVVPATRGIAWSAAKTTLVALANVIIYGVITAVHTVAVGAVATYTANLGILTGALAVLTVVCVAIMIAIAVKSAQKSKEYVKETATNVTEAPQRFYYDATQAGTAIPETVGGNVRDPFDRRRNAEDDPDANGSTATRVHVAVRDELMPPPDDDEQLSGTTNGASRSVDDSSRDQDDAEWTPGYENSEELRRSLAVDVEVDNPTAQPTSMPIEDADGQDVPETRAGEWADYYLTTEDGSSPTEHYLAPGDGASVSEHYLGADDGDDNDQSSSQPVAPSSQEVNVTVDDSRGDTRQHVDVTVDQEPVAPAGMGDREPPPANPPIADEDDDTYHVPDDDYATAPDGGGNADQTIVVNNRDQVHVTVQSAGGSAAGGEAMQSEELDADGNLAPVIFRPDDEDQRSGEMAGASR